MEQYPCYCCYRRFFEIHWSPFWNKQFWRGNKRKKRKRMIRFGSVKNLVMEAVRKCPFAICILMKIPILFLLCWNCVWLITTTSSLSFANLTFHHIILHVSLVLCLQVNITLAWICNFTLQKSPFNTQILEYTYRLDQKKIHLRKNKNRKEMNNRCNR